MRQLTTIATLVVALVTPASARSRLVVLDRPTKGGHFEGGQVARHRDWHGAAHLRRASDESARGGAMSKGEQPQALGQSLQKSFATRWAPVGGLLFWGFHSCPSPKNLSKNGFC